MPFPESKRLIVASKDLLVENFRKPMRLSELAGQVGYSPYYFQRQFLMAFGESPQALLTNLRMEEAKRLLLRSQMTVGEVCFEIGYESQATFTRRFSERYGISPIQYRRLYACPNLALLKSMPACFRTNWQMKPLR